MNEPTPKPAGTWDFYGACAPAELPDGEFGHCIFDTFTLGCFQWEAKSRGKKTKRGKVQYRIGGTRCDPAPAYQQARDYCARKNAGAPT